MTAAVADRMAITLLRRMKEAHSARCTFKHVDPDTVMNQIYSSNSGVRGSVEERAAQTAASGMLDTVVQMMQRLMQIGWHQQTHHGDTDKLRGSSSSSEEDTVQKSAVADTNDVEAETTVGLLSDEYLQRRQQQDGYESLVDEVCGYLAESTVNSTADDVAQQLSLLRSCVYIALHCWEMKHQPPPPPPMTASLSSPSSTPSSPSSALIRTSLVLYCSHCMMDLIISKRTQRSVDPHLHHRWWCPCVSPGIEQKNTTDGSNAVSATYPLDPTAVWRKQILDAMIQRVRTLRRRETGMIEDGDNSAEFVAETNQYSDRDEYEVWRSVRDILSDSLSPGFLRRREIRQELLRDKDQQSLADKFVTENLREASEETEVPAVERDSNSQTEKGGEEETEERPDDKMTNSKDEKEEPLQPPQSHVEDDKDEGKEKEEETEFNDALSTKDMTDDVEDGGDTMDDTTMEESLPRDDVMDTVKQRDRTEATAEEIVVEGHENEMTPNQRTRIDRSILEPATATTSTAALDGSIPEAGSESVPQPTEPSQEEKAEEEPVPPPRVIALRKLSDAERMKRIMMRRTEGAQTGTSAGNQSGSSSSSSNNVKTTEKRTDKPTGTASSPTSAVRDTPTTTTNTTNRKPATGIGATRRGNKRRLPRVAGSSVGNSKRRKKGPISKKKKQQRNKT